MNRRIWMAVLVVVMLAFVGGWVSAQTRVQPVEPTVLAGDNVGFRIEGHREGIAVGHIVIKVDGKWVDTEITAQRYRHLTEAR